MAAHLETTTDKITTQTGTWFYASRSLLRQHFKQSYDTGRNQYALVQWLKEHNPGKIDPDTEYFIIGSEITIPADECSLACIIGQKLYGTATSTGIVDVSASEKRKLTNDEQNNFINTVGETYRGLKINLDKIKVVPRKPTILDIRWAATLVGIHIAESDGYIASSIQDRPMSLPNNTIYFPSFSPFIPPDYEESLMNHEIDHQYTYQIYDPKTVFAKLLKEQRMFNAFQNNQNSINPYRYDDVTGQNLNQIKFLNDIIYNNEVMYEAQAQYIQDYSMSIFKPGIYENLNRTKTDYKIFHP